MKIIPLIAMISVSLVSMAQSWKLIDESQVPEAFKQQKIAVITAYGEDVIDTNNIIVVKTANGTSHYLKIKDQWLLKTIHD